MVENIILFDDDNWSGLLPLTYTRPICELRVGILTIREKWEKYLGIPSSFITQDYLSEKYPIQILEDNFIINSTVLPTPKLVKLVKHLSPNEAILLGDELIAARMGRRQFDRLTQDGSVNELNGIDISNETDLLLQVTRPYHIFQYNDVELERDFLLLTDGRKSQPISETNKIINPDRVFLEEGAKVEYAILNASKGPIYVGRNAEIMEGCIIRGGLAMCEAAVLKMGARIYGATTLGPHSKVGGEVNNVVFTGNSSKGHEGYLGNSVLGEWCNIGADTNSSNLKNNYAEVKLWSYDEERFVKTGQQFCGLIMGDHSKTGINTMLNTGTVVGVNANIFGSGFPRNFVPSYAWGGASGFKTYLVKKSIEVAAIVMSRRNQELTENDIKILESVYYYSSKYRVWEEKAK